MMRRLLTVIVALLVLVAIPAGGVAGTALATDGDDYPITQNRGESPRL